MGGLLPLVRDIELLVGDVSVEGQLVKSLGEGLLVLPDLLEEGPFLDLGGLWVIPEPYGMDDGGVGDFHGEKKRLAHALAPPAFSPFRDCPGSSHRDSWAYRKASRDV